MRQTVLFLRQESNAQKILEKNQRNIFFNSKKYCTFLKFDQFNNDLVPNIQHLTGFLSNLGIFKELTTNKTNFTYFQALAVVVTLKLNNLLCY